MAIYRVDTSGAVHFLESEIFARIDRRLCEQQSEKLIDETTMNGLIDEEMTLEQEKGLNELLNGGYDYV